MEIKDLAGISEPLQKLIEVVAQGVGAISKPYLVRKNADARAYEIKIIAQAIKDNQQELKKIGFEDEKLSLISIDRNTIENEPSLDKRIQERIEYKEQKRQINIESITQKAARNLEEIKEVSRENVDEDWILRFFNYAGDISNEEMQEIWGQILSGEIRKPKSYSLRSLELLRNLSKEEAQIFIKFAKLAISDFKVSFIINFTNEDLLKNKYELSFNERLILEELGLITANDLTYKINKTENVKRQQAFSIGKNCVLFLKNENTQEQSIQVLVFTKIAQELISLVNESPDLDYIQLFADKLGHNNGSIKYARITSFNEGIINYTDLRDVPK